MDRNRYRAVMATLVVGLATIVVAILWLYPDGDSATLPGPIEAVFPLPGDVVARQIGLEVDLPVGYRLLDLVVDGVPIAIEEVSVTEGTAQWFWRPGPGSVVEEWTAGDHTIFIRWDRTAGGNPDPGEYRWSFKVG